MKLLILILTLFLSNKAESQTATDASFWCVHVSNLYIGDSSVPDKIVSIGAGGKITLIDKVTGPTGATGITGNNGTNGSTGQQGITGNTGVAGVTSANGSIGATGSNGTQGATGTAGAVGATGSQGIQGVTGLAGAAGAVGVTGPSGSSVTGPTGQGIVHYTRTVGQAPTTYIGITYTSKFTTNGSGIIIDTLTTNGAATGTAIFTHIYAVQITGKYGGSAVTIPMQGYTVAANLKTIQVNVGVGTVLGLLGATILSVGSGQEESIMIVGD